MMFSTLPNLLQPNDVLFLNNHEYNYLTVQEIHCKYQNKELSECYVIGLGNNFFPNVKIQLPPDKYYYGIRNSFITEML